MSNDSSPRPGAQWGGLGKLRLRILRVLSRGMMIPLLLMAVALSLMLSSILTLSRLDARSLVETPDHMLWSYGQSQAEVLRLLSVVEAMRDTRGSEEDLRHHYDMLLSRLSLLALGPQERYSQQLGVAEDIRIAAEQILNLDPARKVLGTVELDALARALRWLDQTLGQAAHRSNQSYWQELRDVAHRYRQQVLRSFLMMGLALLGVVVIGAKLLMSERRALRAGRLQNELERERDSAAYFRNIAAVVSHQIRTPLSVIDSSAQRALRNPAMAELPELRDGMQRTRINIRRVIHFMDQAMLAGSAEAGRLALNLRDLSLNDLTIMLLTHEGFYGMRDRIRINSERPVPRAICDRNLAFHALCNIVENAIKYSPDDKPVTLRLSTSGPWAVIAVDDLGPGIPKSEQDDIFRRFWRGRSGELQSGSGIGLWLSRQLIELQNGRLLVESDGSSGSRFTMCLPLATAHNDKDTHD